MKPRQPIRLQHLGGGDGGSGVCLYGAVTRQEHRLVAHESGQLKPRDRG